MLNCTGSQSQHYFTPSLILDGCQIIFECVSASPRPQNLGSDCTVHYTTDTGFQGKIISPLDTTFEISGNQNTTYYFVFSVVVNHQLVFQVNILLEYETGKFL